MIIVVRPNTNTIVMVLTFQEVFSRNETLVFLAKAWSSIQQEVGALILIEAKHDLSIFKATRANHSLGTIWQDVSIHNGDE